MKKFLVNGIECVFDPNAKVHGDRYKTADGKRFTGVTSALSAIAKPALIDWAAKEAYKDCHNGANPKECLDNGDFAHKRRGGEAKGLGTLIHEAFEQWDTEHYAVKPVAEFFEREGIKILAHEYPSFNTTYWYAGTFDALVEWKGKRFIVDWKTDKGFYGRGYFAQCAAYLKGFKETYPDKEQPTGYMVIRVDKENGRFNSEINPTTRNGKLSRFGHVFMVDNPAQIEKDFKYFLACLAVYREGNIDAFEEVEEVLEEQVNQLEPARV